MNRDDIHTAVMFDLDSVLALTRQRWHLSPMADPTSSWARYCAARMGDIPNPGPVAAARLHYPVHRVHICSGSDGSPASEDVTRRWLDLARVPFDELKLRDLGDEDTPNEDIKVGHILDCEARGISVVLAYEDWEPSARAIFERTGTPVVGVNPFYPEDVRKFQQQKHDAVGGGL